MIEKSVIPDVNYIHQTYDKINELLVSKDIIKKYSSNRGDVRDVALEGLDISSCRDVLELGCGYGFFIEKLKNRIRKDAFITGIDIVENNREPYLHSVFASGFKGKFIAGKADLIMDFDYPEYDLIICSYSLYFFPDLIKYISRLLKPDGLFIALTHSKFSLIEIIKKLKIAAAEIENSLSDEIYLDRLFFAFSSEDGGSQLSDWFNNIETVDFPNKMIFNKNSIIDCIYYIRQKRSLIFHGLIEKRGKFINRIELIAEEMIISETEKNSKFEITKDDRIFRCTK